MWVNRGVWFLWAVVVGTGASLTHSAVGTWGTLVWMIGCFVLGMVLLLWIPRMAHRKFCGGAFASARFWYQILRWIVLHEKSLCAVRVSIGASYVAENKFEAAWKLLDGIDKTQLAEDVRAAWLNNLAYLRVRSAKDLSTALAMCDEALVLRPYVSRFHHTRAVVLLGLGKVDEAIGVLDAIWRQYTADVKEDLFEAERCYDLGIAWARKGQREYAMDYLERARKTAPDSQWAQKAREFTT